jgi:hypothetical protein
MIKYYYKRDWGGFDHYYKLNRDFIGIHVNLTSPCINQFRASGDFNDITINEITEKEFSEILNEVINKMELGSSVKKFKFT